MKESTAIAIELFAAATVKALRSLGLNALQHLLEHRDEQDFGDALVALRDFITENRPALCNFTAKHCPCDDCITRRTKQDQERTSLSA